MGEIQSIKKSLYFLILISIPYFSSAQWDSYIQSPQKIAKAGMSFIPNSPISQFTNPAALNLLEKSQVFSNSIYFFGLPNIHYLNGGINYKLKSNTLGLGINYLGHSNYTELTLNTAYAMKLANNFHAGLSLKGNFLSLESNYKTQSLLGNLSLIYIVNKIDISFSINNIFRQGFDNLAVSNISNSSAILSSRYRFSKESSFTFETEINDANNAIFRGGLNHQIHKNVDIVLGVSSKNIPFSLGTFYTKHNIRLGVGMGITHFGIISSGGISYVW